MYKCGWQGCEKAYGTLNHLNAHVTMQSHGQKRTPEGMHSSFPCSCPGKHWLTEPLLQNSRRSARNGSSARRRKRRSGRLMRRGNGRLWQRRPRMARRPMDKRRPMARRPRLRTPAAAPFSSRPSASSPTSTHQSLARCTRRSALSTAAITYRIATRPHRPTVQVPAANRCTASVSCP